MAKKMTAALEKKLKAIGINAKTEDEARKKMLDILSKEDVDGMEDEDTDTLITMVESFSNIQPVEEEDEEPEEELDEDEADDEEEADALAAEVEAEDAEEEEPEDEEEPEEEDEEPAAAKEEVKPAKKEKAEKKTKTAKKETEKKVGKRGAKLDPKNNEADRKAFQCISKIFGKDEYEFAWLSSNGVTIKRVGKNGKRGIISIENVVRHDDDSLTGNLYLLTMAKETEKLDELGIEYEICWTKAPFMKAIKMEEIVEIINKVHDIIVGFAEKVDKRLGDNRKKMEENLQKSNEPKKPAKKQEEAAPEEKAETKAAKKTTKKAKK